METQIKNNANVHLDLDTSIITFTDPKGNKFDWSLRQSFEGTSIMGSLGSGKTSGSGRLLASKFLSRGYGGLVLCVKPTEKDLWLEYCRAANRLHDLIIVEPGGEHAFDFLAYESSNRGDFVAPTENVAHVLDTVIRAGEEKQGGRSDDPFWQSALAMLISSTIDLCRLAYGRVSVQDMFDIVMTIPKPEKADDDDSAPLAFKEAFTLAQRRINDQINTLAETFTTEEKYLLTTGNRRFYFEKVFPAVPEARIFSLVDQFFIETYRSLSDKTRSIIDFSFAGFLFRLLKDPIYSLFCSQPSTFTPEDTLDGKIILLNLPVKIYGKAGRDCQLMFKYIWQRAMERRNIAENGRPVFLFVDEAQQFLHEYDAEYQATARSSRIATVYISQNLPNYYANMGGAKSDYRMKALLGTLGTKIFHANSDVDTNRYASELIGDAYSEDVSRNVTFAGQFQAGQNTALRLERMVRPEEFVALKNGGPLNDFQVEGYVHMQSRTFPSGESFEKITFLQKP